MITQSKKILVSLMVRSDSDWREELSGLASLGIVELALFIDSSSFAQRKEVYHLLQASGLKSLPYVHISSDLEEGEIDYLTTTYGTQVFGLGLNNSALAFVATLTKFSSLIALENPSEDKFAALFTDEALSRSNISGVCLDIATLEYDRRYYQKKYESAIHTLDHHSLLATQIGPVSNSWFKKTFRFKSRRLTTLQDLHYIKNLPETYLANLLVLDLKNSLAEQLEIKAYLELMFK